MPAMVKQLKSSDLAFTCPVIGPKDYVTRGPSGWPEAFKRKQLDGRLHDFVKSFGQTLAVHELVELFIMKRELAEKPEPTDWYSIVGFLARTLDTKPALVPHECGIAFWGHVVIASTARNVN